MTILDELKRIQLEQQGHRPGAPRPPFDPPSTNSPETPSSPPALDSSPQPSTPHAATPARNLSKKQAWKELETLKAQGIIDFKKKWGTRAQLLFPVSGVDFRAKWSNQPATKSYPIDPRLAVATVRLSLWAKKHGVTEIAHMGFMGRSSKDRHGQGRAVDLAGFKGVDPKTGIAFDYDILRDWGKIPKRQNSPYRLDPSTHKGGFFHNLYGFLTTEFRDRKPGPSKIGERSYILCPDHPSPRLSRTHSDHFHVEVPPAN
jgi:hypothetical protein